MGHVVGPFTGSNSSRRSSSTSRSLDPAASGRSGQLDERRSGQALDDLAALPLRRVSHLGLLSRIWELRDNLTAYVALTEILDALLLTADGAGGRYRCEVEVLE